MRVRARANMRNEKLCTLCLKRKVLLSFDHLQSFFLGRGLLSHDPSCGCSATKPGDCKTISNFWDSGSRNRQQLDSIMMTLKPARLVRRLSSPLIVSSKLVSSIAFVRDDEQKFCATGGSDKKVRIFCAEQVLSGSILPHQTIPLKSKISSLSWGPYDQRIATAMHDGGATILDAEQGNIKTEWKASTMCIRAIDWACSNHIVSGGDDGIVRLWDTNQGTIQPLLLSLLLFAIFLVISRVSTSYTLSQAFIIPMETCSETGCSRLMWKVSFGAAVCSVRVCPTNHNLITCGSSDSHIRIWDIRTQEHPIVDFKGHEASISSVQWAPDGNSLVSSATDSTVKKWPCILSESSREECHTYRGHLARKNFTGLGISSSGLIACGSETDEVRPALFSVFLNLFLKLCSV